MRVAVEHVEVGAVETGGDVRTAIAVQTAQIDDEYGSGLTRNGPQTDLRFRLAG